MTVDLTPVLPGGDNGGAKLVATSLVRQLALLAPSTQFTLLTSATSHAELAGLDAPNVRRQCVDADLLTVEATGRRLGLARRLVRGTLNTLVPSDRARRRIKDAAWTLLKRRLRAELAASTPADLLFCPFTAPFYYDPRVPLVALVHDLQYLQHPEFFEPRQRADRHRHFLDACARADRLVCVSEFVRQTVLANSRLASGKVQTIHSAVVHAAEPEPAAGAVAQHVLAGLGMIGPRYLLYPANVWPHKNHKTLVDAFALYRQRVPTSDLALVCTGAPNSAAEELKDYARRSLPAGSFGFAGFVPEREFGALLQRSRAVIFPSLYEGFGLPILEAMACDRPVLCSNSTSLPEVAGDAALLFDPHDPAAIASAVEQLEAEPALEKQLVQRGRARVATFGGAREKATRYLALFEDVASARSAEQL